MSNISFDNTEIAFAMKKNGELREAYYLFSMMNKQFVSNWGSQLAAKALKMNIPFVKTMVKYSIFEQFCGGETFEETKSTIDQLEIYQVKSFLDYGVEGKEAVEDFEEAKGKLIEAIDYAEDKDAVPVVTSKITSLMRNELLEKYSADEFLSEKEQEEIFDAKERLRQIGERALHAQVGIYIDAEESWMQAAMDEMVEELMQDCNKDLPIIFNTIQLYRHDRLAFLKKAHQRAKEKGYILAVKLVRGAYMEKERDRADELNYPSPIQSNKAACDRDYDDALRYCIEHINEIAICCATHNEDSVKLLCDLMEQKGITKNHPHIYFSQLYGMSDHITFTLADLGYNVAKYIPYGPIKEVVPYLVRRAKENSSVDGQMSRELALLKKEMQRRGFLS